MISSNVNAFICIGFNFSLLRYHAFVDSGKYRSIYHRDGIIFHFNRIFRPSWTERIRNCLSDYPAVPRRPATVIINGWDLKFFRPDYLRERGFDRVIGLSVPLVLLVLVVDWRYSTTHTFCVPRHKTRPVSCPDLQTEYTYVRNSAGTIMVRGIR